MAWVAEGAQVTVDWHVFAGGRWLVEAVPVGRTAPVNVYVTKDRMATVEYRHQAGECRGECRLTCGHTLTYGCDCDTIEAEAAGQEGMVIETVVGKHEFAISAAEADRIISEYENDPYLRNTNHVTRRWDRVSYVVSVTADGHSRANGLPFVSYAVPLLDI